MLKILVNGLDITENIERNSLQITEQLNNRRNTASFTVLDYMVSEGQDVKIYDGALLADSYSLWVTTVKVNNIFEYNEKFKPGQKIILSIDQATEEMLEILSVDFVAQTITFTEVTKKAHSINDAIGFLKFAGTTQKTPDETIGKTDILSSRVSAVDYSYLYDRENIAETYENKYAREILGRVIYRFVQPNKEKVIFWFETLDEITTSGVARVPVLNDNDRISGNYSVDIWATGAWNAIYSIQLVTPVDLTDLDKVRLWIKFAAGITSKLTGVKIKIGNNSSNYYEWDDALIYNAIWSYDSFDFNRAAEIGSVDLTSIDFIEITLESIASIASGEITLDLLQATEWGFTLRNTQRGEVIFEDVRVQYQKPTVFTEKLAKNLGYFWYIDYNRDLNFFEKDSKTAPISITDTSQNYDNLKVSVDLTNLKNRQTVRGGIAPGEALYTQEQINDWEVESWRLDYPPKGLKVYTDTGAWYEEKTVWVENLVAETSVDYVFNFNEKVVRRASDAILAADTKIKLEYFPYKDIRVRVQDNTSIATMKALVWGNGVFDGAVINDNTIRTFEEARTRAQAEIEAYKNPIITITFDTEKDGLEAGQLIQITNSLRSINDLFLIQQVRAKSKNIDSFVYNITASSTMFGYIEFFQLLFRSAEKISVDVSELVDIVINLDEVMTIGDNYILTKKDNIFYAMWPTPGETPNDAFADFSQAS